VDPGNWDVESSGCVTGVTTENGRQYPTELGLDHIYPNSSLEHAIITFHTPRVPRVMLDVYDAMGRKVIVIAHRFYITGSHKERIDASSLSSGPYIYRLITDVGEVTKPMFEINK